MKMFRRSRLAVLLFVGTILNVFVYLYITDVWKIFRYSSAIKLNSLDYSPRRPQSIETDFSEIIHRAVIAHNFSRENISDLVNRLLRVELRAENLKKDKSSAAGRTTRWSLHSGDLNASANTLLPKEPRDRDLNEQMPLAGALNDINPAVVAAFPTEHQVNPHNFKYLINEPLKCFNLGGSEKPIFLLVVIFTIHRNVDYRNAVRQTWGSPSEIDGMRIVTMFLMARNSDRRLHEAVLKESELYHDILMEDFVDTYRNLTFKTIMGIKWMSTYCRHAKYMFKTDDDMWVNYANLVRHLNQSPSTDFVTGKCVVDSPIRDPNSKWYMPKTLYNETMYPPFCTGSGYALSGDVPPRIYQTSLSTRFLYLEDIFVAVCLNKLKIVPLAHPKFNNLRVEYTFCHYNTSFTASHMVTPREMFKFWVDQNTQTHKC